MLGAVDYVGLSALVGSLGGAVAACIAAWYGNKTHTQSTNIAAAVTTPPDKPALGVLASDAADVIEHVHEVVCDGKDQAKP